jgi:hypothetical protein
MHTSILNSMYRAKADSTLQAHNLLWLLSLRKPHAHKESHPTRGTTQCAQPANCITSCWAM